ncbi:hypothetical protein RRG08_011769 [Elysia crispata]|uniref:Uncharacterized protein n=1 Tax=Elysia crispata TaxID=231223 RepID=A0AAE0ZQK8_9GAST|nr:hypothetical protein RRG08_011769 [Elysia crispata]
MSPPSGLPHLSPGTAHLGISDESWLAISCSLFSPSAAPSFPRVHHLKPVVFSPLIPDRQTKQRFPRCLCDRGSSPATQIFNI